MDFSVVHILLCLFLTHTTCLPYGAKEALDNVTQLIQTGIQSTLDNLSGPGLPDVSCDSLNSTELFGPQLQPLAAHHFSSLRCYMLKASSLVPDIGQLLLTIAQYAQDVERLMSGQVVDQLCSLPSSGDDYKDYENARCLLEFVNKWFQNTTDLTE